MNFLNPGFLYALSVLAIPVIIHLFNFRRFKRVYFSNVQFLKEVEAEQSSRENIKNLLILLARLLALLCLVLAFARPFIAENNGADAQLQQVVSIYIDNSYSMETVNKEGTLLDNAKRNAQEIAAGFDINARFRLVTNDFEGKHQRLLDFEEFKNAVGEIKISAATRTVQQVVNRLQAPNVRYAYILSDFQSGFIGTSPVNVTKDVNIALVKLSANAQPNISVDSSWFFSPVRQPQAAENLVVRLKNFGTENAENVAIKLHVDGQQKAIGSLNIPAGKSITDTLRFSGLAAGWHEGEIQINDHPLTFDNQLRFAFKVHPSMKVLLINGQQTGGYLRALFSADSFFKLTEMSAQNINYNTFDEYGLIVLNGLSDPSSGLTQQLKNYLQRGGSAVVFPNMGNDLAAQSSLFKGIGLPGISGAATEETKVATIELKHALFSDMFEQLPKNIDLPVANKFITLEPGGQGREELLQFAGNRSYLSQYSVGSGKAYLFTSGLQAEDSNLPKHPFFLPMLYKMAFSGLKGQRLYYAVGVDNLLETEKIALGANQSLTLTSANFEAIPELTQSGGNPRLYIADQIKNAGFYRLKKADSLLSIYAFNNSGSESKMEFSSETAIKQAFGKHPVAFYDTKNDSLPRAALIAHNGVELWKLFVILSALFLAAEILIIKFFKPKKQHEPSR